MATVLGQPQPDPDPCLGNRVDETARQDDRIAEDVVTHQYGIRTVRCSRHRPLPQLRATLGFEEATFHGDAD
ncbi:MAG TPA: hypothetical protein VMF35_16180 [Acidimicrobiales bacterium]|nr:hypothetical protein [Acidimicrobiales bacterium]